MEFDLQQQQDPMIEKMDKYESSTPDHSPSFRSFKDRIGLHSCNGIWDRIELLRALPACKGSLTEAEGSCNQTNLVYKCQLEKETSHTADFLSVNFYEDLQDLQWDSSSGQ
eukprot:1162031-Pelagomonas_calceolata.AAC.6